MDSYSQWGMRNLVGKADGIDICTLGLLLLCHFLIRQRPLLPQTARTSGQRGDEPEGELTADACD
jgi:hypothetical protein